MAHNLASALMANELVGDEAIAAGAIVISTTACISVLSLILACG